MALTELFEKQKTLLNKHEIVKQDLLKSESNRLKYQNELSQLGSLIEITTEEIAELEKKSNIKNHRTYRSTDRSHDKFLSWTAELQAIVGNENRKICHGSLIRGLTEMKDDIDKDKLIMAILKEA